MKHTISRIVFSVLALGLFLTIQPARAADAPTGATLGPDEAVVLKQTLDVLGQVLSEIQTQLTDTNTVIAKNPTLVSATLAALGAHLSAIDATLKGEPVVAAEAPAPVAIAPEPEQPVAVAPPAPAEPAPPVITPIAENPQPLAANTPSNQPSDENTSALTPSAGLPKDGQTAEASVGSSVGSKVPIGIGIAAVLLAGFGLYLWLRGDKEEEPQMKPVKQKAMMMVDKQNAFDKKIVDAPIDY